MTFVQKSCENDVVALIVRPATTARIVANAIAEMNAKKTAPARACASSGALMFVPPCALMIVRPHDRRRPESQERRHNVEAADQHHRPHHAVRAVFASGTV